MYIKTGIQLYTCRNEFFADKKATFERLAKMGYDGVEFFMGFDMPAKELKGLLDDYGLQPCGWHTGLHLLENELIYSTMEYHAAIGNRYIGVTLPRDLMDTAEKCTQLNERFAKIEQTLSQNGFVFEYHNHWWEFEPIETGELPYDLIFGTNPKICTQLDVGNALKGNAKAFDYLRKYPDRSPCVHMKPYSAADGFNCDIGKDDVDWKPIVDHCYAHGTKWFIFEHEQADIAMQRAESCLAGLKAFMK
ncbi:MAG: sugar phosphate isomerase/epimerase [Clostridiales bacterium]|nr:sugar phosphate isomerase/epimerase [Clostridiales bacterium]